MRLSWSQYLQGESLFVNAVRLRYLIWTIQQFSSAPSRLVEVGAGSASTSVLLADLGYEVTSLDIDQELVEAAARRYSGPLGSGKLSLVRADLRQLPFADRAFDVVFHQGVLEHLDDESIVAGLREQERVAGLVVFDVPNHRYGAKSFGDERLLRPRIWRDLISQANLQIVEQRGRGFKSFLFLLPHALFTRTALVKFPGFARSLGNSSIFVCRSTRRS